MIIRVPFFTDITALSAANSLLTPSGKLLDKVTLSRGYLTPDSETPSDISEAENTER